MSETGTTKVLFVAQYLQELKTILRSFAAGQWLSDPNIEPSQEGFDGILEVKLVRAGAHIDR
jgi:hypothetical protein